MFTKPMQTIHLILEISQASTILNISRKPSYTMNTNGGVSIGFINVL